MSGHADRRPFDQEHLVTVRGPSVLDEFNVTLDEIQDRVGDVAEDVTDLGKRGLRKARKWFGF